MDNQKILRLLRLILAGLTFVYLCHIFLRPIGEPDFFWHLSTGRWIIEHLSLPTHDPFSYTTPALLSSREHFILTSYWLSQILYYGIYYVSGWNGFILLRFIILGVIIYFVYKRAKGSDRNILLSITAITMIVFAMGYTFERPQVFSFIFFAILLYLLENLKEACSVQRAAFSVKEGKSVHATRYTLYANPYTLYAKRYAMLPLLMLFWANMHGGYILGQGVILVYLLSEGLKFLHPSLKPMERLSYKRFLIIGTAGILSALINPNTYKAIPVAWSVSEFSSMKHITEHQSTITVFKTLYAYDILGYWLLLFVAVVMLLYRILRKRFDIQAIVMLIALGYFSFTQERYVAFFLIWAVPFIAISLTTPTKGEGGDKVTPLHPPLFKGGKEGGYIKYICVLLSLFIVAILVTKEKKFDNVKNITNFKTGQWVDDYYPEDTVDFIIDNNIKGNMYNYHDWGGYLIWRFYPEEKVFIDGRNLYELQYSQWLRIITATLKPEAGGMPYYKAILESYRVRYMVIPLFAFSGEMLPIVAEMVNDKEWIPVFLRGNSMVFVKNTPENYDVIHTYSIPKDKFVADLFKMLDDKTEKSPGDFRLYLTKGDLYYSQWKFKEAREEYEKVFKINPFNSTAREKLELLNRKYSR